jgi:hypothetical protein
VFSKSNWSALVLGRSNVQTIKPLEIERTAGRKVRAAQATIAAAEDGRAPYFENTPQEFPL